MYIALVHNIYSCLFTGEKSKIEKLVQMAWTFVNDRQVVPLNVAHTLSYFIGLPSCPVSLPHCVCNGSLKPLQ